MDRKTHHAIIVALEERRNGVHTPITAQGADLSGVNLDSADLGHANFNEANLTLGSLAGANLERANLQSANLHSCDLSGADLTEANLRGADLSKADFSDTLMVGVDLRGAFLRGMLGEPLSLAGAIIDDATVTHSGLTEAQVNQWLERGARFENPKSIPPSMRLVESVRPPSIVPRLRQQEVSARHEQVEEDIKSVPTSRRAFDLLNNLIEQAQGHEELPMSLRSTSLPQVDVEKLEDSGVPQIGEHYLGCRVDRELASGSTAKSFVGTSADGQQVLIKVFNPFRPGAALQLPAFQRGLRAMNRALLEDEGTPHVVGLLSVSRDLTGYVSTYYPGGSLEEVVDTNITLDAGLQIFESLCRSLQFLHGKNLLVRSMKPSNLIMDGLRPLLSELDMLDLPTLAQTSPNLAGYGPYVAPEEVARMGTRSPTADIYGLGKLFEYLLTGNPPFKPLTGPSVLESSEHIPPYLVGVVRRATAADPADRYQYVDEVLEELARFRAEGAAARLREPLRVRTVSRLQSLPSLAPPADPAPRRAPLSLVPTAAEVPEPTGLLSTQRRWGLAFFSWFVLLAACGFVAGVPSRVELLERFWIAVAALSGCALWFLPARSGARVVYLGLFAATAWLVHWVGPLPIAQARWHYDLAQGDRPAKERAVTNLIRSGHRRFDGLDLRGLSLSHEDLANVSFRGAQLQGSNLSYSFVQGANFSHADLAQVSLVAADLRAAFLADAKGLQTVRCDDWTNLPEGWDCTTDGRLDDGNADESPADEEQPEKDSAAGASPSGTSEESASPENPNAEQEGSEADGPGANEAKALGATNAVSAAESARREL